MTQDEGQQPPQPARAEHDRVYQRPTTRPPEVLSMFYAEVAAWDKAEEFGGKLRELVYAGVKAGLEADFDSDVISETDVPGWVAESWEEASARYAAQGGEEPWTVQDVLYSFDPKQREWSWWDVTLQSGNIVCVWVDSAEEPVYACEELRWMIFACGAHSLVGPLLRDPREWEQQRSLGTRAAAD